METKNLLKSLKRRLGLITAILAMLTASQSAWAWSINSGSKIYFIDSDSWGGCNMYYWGNGWSNNQSFSKITNTTIYYYSFSSTWTNLSGFKFNKAKDNWDKQSSGNIETDVSGNVYFLGASTSKQTDMTKLNGTAKLVLMVSEDGTTYSKQTNASCVAKISGYNLGGGNTSTTETNASTGSSSEATIYPAYGSTITYELTSATGYTFKGFSTQNSTTLPNDVSTSKQTQTAKSSGGNCTTYYAYFAKACPAVDQATITGDGTMYVGDNKTYTASATGGTITSYTWTVPSGLSGTSTSSTISITATGSGSKTLKAKATNDCGNIGTDGSKSITVNALPSVTNQNATAVSNSQINLTWKHNANKTTVMVVRYLSSASITDPTQGQEYNTTDKKTIGAGTVIYKGTDESFQSTGLTAATSYTYYFYTVNNNYYSSGVNYNATTHSACVPPTSVTTAAASNIKSTAATLGGSYTGGSGTPTEVGIEWVSGKSGQETASMGSSFSVNVTGLSANTEYTYKAYAKACETTVYGDVKTLTTCAVPVMAQATRNNDYGSDYLKFNVKALSLGCTVTEWGVNVYSNSGCTSLVKSVQGAGSLSTSPQVVNVTGLISNTNYWVKSYAKYDDGDKMVEASTVTRWQPKVVLGETSSSSVTSNSATLSSSTLLGGGAKTSMTALFRYSTSEGSIASGATIASLQTQVGQTISANLTGLTSGTTYYYRVEVTYTDDKGNVSLIGETNSFTTLNVHGDITGLPASPLAKCSADEPLQLAPQCSTATSWTYSSSNTSAATVSNSGLITIKGAGSTNITVTAKATGYADKQAQFTINVAANPTLTLSGSGAKSASATYPWEYMTITATAGAGSELTWNDLVAPAGVNYVYETGSADNVKQLKSEQTANPNTDKFTVSATATKSGCSTTKTYDVYIYAAPAEDCGK